jgi:hypothetical protein
MSGNSAIAKQNASAQYASVLVFHREAGNSSSAVSATSNAGTASSSRIASDKKPPRVPPPSRSEKTSVNAHAQKIMLGLYSRIRAETSPLKAVPNGVWRNELSVTMIGGNTLQMQGC